MNSLNSLLSFFGFVPDLIIFIMCVSYMSKSKTSDATLLFIGSLIGALTRIFYVASPYWSSISDSGAVDVMVLFRAANAISLVGSIIFCVGFVQLVKRLIALLTLSRTN